MKFKGDKGITLVSLIIYVIGLIVIMGIIAFATSFYQKNVLNLNNSGEVNSEFNKFNSKMIEETKEAGNEVKSVTENVIKFSNGDTYTLADGKIYQNSIVVCKNVKEFLVDYAVDGDKQILKIYIRIGKGKVEVAKTVSYVVEIDKEEVKSGSNNVWQIKGIGASEIAKDASYIGKYVNYTVEGKDTKWRIFYADDSNIYLISSGYLEGETLNISNYTNASDIKDARIKKWIKYVDKYPTATGICIRTCAYLLDTEVWNNKYSNNYAQYVVGAPTIELFNASYKITHPEKYIEEIIEDENGYNIKWNTDKDYSDRISGINTSELENLYVLNDSGNVGGYWLASPTAGSSSPPFYVWCNGEISYNGNPMYVDYLGFRAIVCLNSDVRLIDGEDGTYNIRK